MPASVYLNLFGRRDRDVRAGYADQGQPPRPMTFWGCAMFQWVNAKGWSW